MVTPLSRSGSIGSILGMAGKINSLQLDLNLTMFSSQTCPVCESTQSKSLFSVADGKLVQCIECKLVFYTPLPSSAELAAFYDAESYRQNYHHSPLAGMQMAKIRYQQLKSYFRQRTSHDLGLSPQLRYLDVGCGEGDLLKVLAAEGWDTLGTEISAKAVAQAGEGWRDRIQVGDINSVDFPSAYFDLITMYHVIEHLLDPVDALSRVYNWLKPGGILFIETPNWGGLGARLRGRSWSLIIPPEHLTYFQKSSLSYALSRAGYGDFQVFSSTPQVLESLDRFPIGVRQFIAIAYRLAPYMGLGANLQALAFRDH
ncbi:class I SAM-dependent methyltransferase [Leptolyngbya sp. PCC 6406]|uniref:class I SAM-dependent methyltransferase n=1 Tax=Leptolyngbya sp. PCC 6406 TaxID=1173264 RepID=UPI0018725F23|nr:class I SAM-dependent methyltransferase [Leptolyngbya sp. PCC 6406]